MNYTVPDKDDMAINELEITKTSSLDTIETVPDDIGVKLY